MTRVTPRQGRIAVRISVVTIALAGLLMIVSGGSSAQSQEQAVRLATTVAARGTAPSGATFKTMCAFTRPVRCENATHGGAPGSNVIFSRFDPQNPVEQDWNLVKAINPATGKNLVTRSWPPAAQWVRNRYRGKPVYMNVTVEARTCQGANGITNDAPISHCHGPNSRGVLWIVLGKIMHRAALVNVRASSNATFPMFLEGLIGDHLRQPTLAGVGPGCITGLHKGTPCDRGLKRQFWHRFGG